MIFVKISREGREINMINTVSKINLSKIGWEGAGSTSIWIMSLNILVFFGDYPLPTGGKGVYNNYISKGPGSKGPRSKRPFQRVSQQL